MMIRTVSIPKSFFVHELARYSVCWQAAGGTDVIPQISVMSCPGTAAPVGVQLFGSLSRSQQHVLKRSCHTGVQDTSLPSTTL
jgi:hypothetical protein